MTSFKTEIAEVQSDKKSFEDFHKVEILDFTHHHKKIESLNTQLNVTLNKTQDKIKIFRLGNKLRELCTALTGKDIEPLTKTIKYCTRTI